MNLLFFTIRCLSNPIWRPAGLAETPHQGEAQMEGKKPHQAVCRMMTESTGECGVWILTKVWNLFRFAIYKSGIKTVPISE